MYLAKSEGLEIKHIEELRGTVNEIPILKIELGYFKVLLKQTFKIKGTILSDFKLLLLL